MSSKRFFLNIFLMFSAHALLLSCNPGKSAIEKEREVLQELARMLPQTPEGQSITYKLLDNSDSVSNGIKTVNSAGRITYLNLDKAGLKGVFPENIGYLSELKSLSIKNNSELTGSIPKSIGLLEKLEDLQLPRNNLSGELPKEFYNLINLRRVHLQNNKFNGPLSDKISNFEKLFELALSHNDFSGEIHKLPSKQLMHLYINDNKFDGVPPFKTFDLEKDFPKLMHIDISNNKFGMDNITLGLFKLNLQNYKKDKEPLFNFNVDNANGLSTP